jgi:hypothetical protein
VAWILSARHWRWCFKRLIDAKATQQIGADRHYRSASRTTHRNESRLALVSTTASDVELRILETVERSVGRDNFRFPGSRIAGRAGTSSNAGLEQSSHPTPVQYTYPASPLKTANCESRAKDHFSGN